VSALVLTRLDGAVSGRALAADLRVVEAGAELDFGGVAPEGLARIVGMETAARWIAAGRVAPSEAIDAGFALAGPADAVAARIAGATDCATRATLRLLAGCEGRSLDETLDVEEDAVRACLADPETARRVAAWVGDRAGHDPATGPDFVVDRRGRVIVATLARPARRNAMRGRTCGELHALLDDLEVDADAEALVLTGAGDTFCAGEDLREAAVGFPGRVLLELPRIQDLTRRIARSTKRVIAALPGPAVGLGAELAIACHAQVATPTAALSFPEAQLGLLPTNGAFALVPRRAGPMRALGWFLTGWPVSAAEAARLGLLTRVVPHEDLLSAAVDLA
jgi:enoyl-CoA hydratase/carnithine racemase